MSQSTALFVGTEDYSAQLRGRSVPASERDSFLASGTGWVPANLGINCVGEISDSPLFDSFGDLRLVPDQAFSFSLPARNASAGGTEVFLGDLVRPDGTPWDGCPRGFAKSALGRLRERAGLRLVASFEHEFQLPSIRPSNPFSLQSFRAAEPFGSLLLKELAAAGLEPETWLSEYGTSQYEVTLAPVEGIRAADHAIATRAIARDLAAALDIPITFAPLSDPDATGNGFHLHFSLIDETGAPMLHDPGAPGAVSELGRRFAAGLIRHAQALSAIAAPSPASYFRLGEHRWSASGPYLGVQDREAFVRVCPLNGLSKTAAAKQFNLELRVADATANPWLLLGMVAAAGLHGIEHYEPIDPGAQPDGHGTASLPGSQAEAIDALESDAVVRSWLPDALIDAFVAVRRSEASTFAGTAPELICERIAHAY